MKLKDVIFWNFKNDMGEIRKVGGSGENELTLEFVQKVGEAKGVAVLLVVYPDGTAAVVNGGVYSDVEEE